MQRTNGLNHVATLTADVDSLKAFHADLFGADTLFDRTDAGRRHAMIVLGPGSGIHAFEVAGDALPPSEAMIRRGRLDHVAVTARDGTAFEEIRQRAIALGVGDGDVVDYGAMRAFHVVDPDGSE